MVSPTSEGTPLKSQVHHKIKGILDDREHEMLDSSRRIQDPVSWMPDPGSWLLVSASRSWTVDSGYWIQDSILLAPPTTREETIWETPMILGSNKSTGENFSQTPPPVTLDLGVIPVIGPRTRVGFEYAFDGVRDPPCIHFGT